MPTWTFIAAAAPELLRGLGVTIMLTLCAALISLAAGTLSAAIRVTRMPMLSGITRLYVSLMRGTPALVQLFVVFFGLPRIGLGGYPFAAAALAIGLNSGAYVSEILRAAVQAVPAGQIEAGQVIGLTRLSIWRRIVLPQAFAWSLPALANEATLLLKTTPLASVVGVIDLTFEGQMVIARSFRPTEILLAIAFGYIALSILITRGIGHLEQRRTMAQA